MKYINTRIKIHNSEYKPPNEIEEENPNIKTCTKCKEEKKLNKFYFRGEYDDTQKDKNDKTCYRSHCISCINTHSKNVRKEFKENPLRGKKKCIKCNSIHKFDMFWISKENRDEMSDECKKCHESIYGKQCNRCYSKFHKDKKNYDGFHTICKACRNNTEMKRRLNENKEQLKVTCEYCNKIISNNNNLKAHQKTKFLKSQRK